MLLCSYKLPVPKFHYDRDGFVEADVKHNYLKWKSFIAVLNKIDILIIFCPIFQLCVRCCVCVRTMDLYSRVNMIRLKMYVFMFSKQKSQCS